MQKIALTDYAKGLLEPYLEPGEMAPEEISIPDNLRFGNQECEQGGAIIATENGGLEAIILPGTSSKIYYSPDLSALAEWGDALVIGLWHTHPINTPPSATDRKTARQWRQLQSPLSLVITPQAHYWI